MADRKAKASAPAQNEAPAISVTAEIVAFAPGLYAIDMQGSAAAGLPCGRIHPVDGGFASTLAETGFVVPSGAPAFLRVPGPGPAQILITLYAATGAPPPDLRMRRIDVPSAAQISAPPRAEAGLLMVSVQGAGDLTAPAGDWAGRPGSGLALEGFAIATSALLPEGSLEYQGSLGAEWDTDWHQAGSFCGTRGVALPLIGVRIRLNGAASARITCRTWGSFIGYGVVGPFADGDLCACAGAPLEALRIEFSGQ